ncbi:MAG: cation:proton antiporter [Gammaproteobacteria bacterium]|nr:cation:proton antiporter [Gammaproteobacteria bacterium]
MPVAESHAIPHLREAVVFLIAAGLIVPALHRLRVSPVLGYLAIGALIGPYGLDLLRAAWPWLGFVVIADLDGVRRLAELGVVFLLFMIGLELSLDRLLALRRLVFGLGTLQIVLTGAVIAAIAWAFGNAVPAAVVLGACLALSSTAIVMDLLLRQRRLGTPLGRASFSILLAQDLAVVPILLLLDVYGSHGAASIGADLLLALLRAVLAIALIYAAGKWLLRPVLRAVAQTRSPEMFTACVLLAVLGTAVATGAAGLSMALGAFLAGLLLAETEYRHEIQIDIEPFKGLLLGLFFLSVGMGIDYRVILLEPAWLLASVAGLFVIKAVITALLGRAFGLPRHAAIETGLLLGQGGEFGFIVVGLAMEFGLLPQPVGQFMLIVTSLTMVATPLVASLGHRLAAGLEHREAQQHAHQLPDEELEGHVIIAGFGRVGRTVAAVLEAEQIPYLALDHDAATVTHGTQDKLPVYFGDATRFDLLRRARCASAQAIVITLDTASAAEQIIHEIRRIAPEVPIYARARDGAHAVALHRAGAALAVPETIEASLQLASRVLLGAGATEDAARRRIEHQRSIDLNNL